MTRGQDPLKENLHNLLRASMLLEGQGCHSITLRGQILFRSAELVRTQKLARQPLYNPPMSTTAIAEALEGSIDWVMFRLLGRPAIETILQGLTQHLEHGAYELWKLI